MSNDKYTHAIRQLNALQYQVTQEKGTERPFDNQYWNHKEEGIYVDIVSGKPLFSSQDKYDSGTGWPSFTKPIDKVAIATKSDTSLGINRVEVRSSEGDSHLGHVFQDGPKDKGGTRFCINSASLRFIHKDQLVAEGYGEYLKLFVKKDNKASTPALQKAILAGGCFWGMEELLRNLDGVSDVRVGYSGGETKNPNYEQVKTGLSGHAESVEITFNPQKLSYETLLKFFFRIHNPTTKDQQGNDIGNQYRSAIFYTNDEQKNIAYNVIALANKSAVFDKKIVTEITKSTTFYPAEEYHQDYLQKNPSGYTCHYIRKEWTF